MADRRSLRVELVLTLTLLLAMASASLALAAELLGHQRHRQQELQELERLASGLVAVATPVLGPSAAAVGRVELEQILRPSLGTLGVLAVEIHAVDAAGARPLLSVGLAPALAPPASSDRIVSQASASDAGEVLVVDHPVRTFQPAAPSMATVLRVVAAPSPWTQAGDWQDVLLLTVGVGCVVLVLGATLLELQVLRPLSRVRAAASAVTGGNLAARAPEQGPAEIAALARAFNETTAALGRQLEEIAGQRAQLARAERLAGVGLTAAGVAHEVGNPLAAVLGYIDLLLDPRNEPPLDPEHRDLLERTRSQLHRIRTTLGQLLDLGRPLHAAPVRVELAGWARDALEVVRHDPRCEGVDVALRSPATLAADTDPGLLEQVLHNLVVNACRAARAAGAPARVEVRLGADADGVLLEVQDTGTGVPAEVRERLFEPFFSTAPAGRGSGLGLAICQGLAQALGGSLECLATGARPPLEPAAGPGAVFALRLPARAPGNTLDGAYVPPPATSLP